MDVKPSGRRNTARRTQTAGKSPVAVIGPARLQEWAKYHSQPSELLIRLMSSLSEINEFVNRGSVKAALLKSFVLCLEKVVQAKNHENNFSKLLEVLASSCFYQQHVCGYLQNNNCKLSKQIADTVVKLIRETSRQVPSASHACLDVLTFIQKNYKQLDCDVTALNETIQLFNLSESTQVKKDKHRLKKWKDSQEPPNDIRDISIFPTKRDLDTDFKPFLRANKVCGAYRNKKHYFDVMFRLVREDFIQPLRESIKTYQSKGKSDYEFYENVRITGVDLMNGIEHILQLDRDKVRQVKWDTERRLIFGSLVCISNNKFQTIIYATVSQMDRDELKKGVLRVKFQNCLEDVYKFSSEDRLTMTENPSLFEAYRHVLEGLQEMMERPLPMEKHLVFCDTDLKEPAYLTSTTKYNLSGVMKDGSKSKAQLFRALQPVSWPGTEKMALNSQQHAAVKTALTKELALLQGPPGTGKTYVGLKLMRVLLENIAQRVPGVVGKDEKQIRDPVLVVCYTNHALDQFLEEMLDFCPDGVVRVGGRGDCEALEKFNLTELRQKHKGSNGSKIILQECQKEMSKIGRQIKSLAYRMQAAQLSIQDENLLVHWMKASHRKYFCNAGAKKKVLRQWMNSSDIDFEKQLQNSVERHLINLFLTEKMSLDDKIFKPDSKKIKAYHKTKLYRFWSLQYQDQYGFLPTNTLLGDNVLMPFVGPAVMKVIRKSKMGIKKWLLGKSVKEQLDAIEEIQKDRSKFEARIFDNKEEYSRIRDQRVFGDEEEEQGKKTVKSKRKFTRTLADFPKAKMLGVVIADENDEEEDSDWQTVTKKWSFSQVLRRLRATQPMTVAEENDVEDILQLELEDRYRLYKLWVTRFLNSMNMDMRGKVEKYENALMRKMEVRQIIDGEILKQAKVIGMTTTGAAKHRKLLQDVKPRVVVVEEAAEVLEAHIVTALSEHCQHLILIGDHKQLRPKAEVYQLAKQFGLEVSLFERLVNNDVNCVQLTEQHRMRPEISVYMKHIYPNLIDSASVVDRENVRGVEKNIFFINHNRSEGSVKHSRSKLNDYEARYIMKLADYLIDQGYSAEDITILATYGGQVSLIKELMNNSEDEFLRQIRVSTVDNFQGEQSKIILLSLVRSNTQESVGFLSTDNRVCVALSRAQYGMYVIGNVDLLARHSQLWSKIKQTAKERGEIGETLRLRCQQHRKVSEIKNVSDFKKILEEGCGKKCGGSLNCGHACPEFCHGFSHDNVLCSRPCKRKCPQGHPCLKFCGEECALCCVPQEVESCSPVSFKVESSPIKLSHSRGSASLSSSTQSLSSSAASSDSSNQKKKSKSKQPSVVKTRPETLKEKIPPSCEHFFTGASRSLSISTHSLSSIVTGSKPVTEKKSKPHLKAQQSSATKIPSGSLKDKITLPVKHSPTGKGGSLSSSTHSLSSGATDGDSTDQKSTLLLKHQPVIKVKCPNTCSRGHPCTKKANQPCPPCPRKLKCGHGCRSVPALQQTQGGADSSACTRKCRKVCRNGHKCPGKCHEPCPVNCAKALACGHPCGDSFKKENIGRIKPVPCVKSCTKQCPHGHRCTSTCSTQCPPCHVMTRARFPCDHVLEVRCHEIDREVDKCKRPCEKKCPRGHPCNRRHHKSCPPCSQLTNTLADCGHFVYSFCDESSASCRICSVDDLIDNILSFSLSRPVTRVA
ncbi:NFX1-type zinc finger-containing protein 1-like [Physella acuta]|uniref:NFX1-type zinc finger-containing protein 1-like n=1 Tax=Physella acuta TaxID=109671 RepID=UPI0027DBB04D|nr:NFX1-type zinc finger-containing protein 1-like [Physella acuta]